jgi:hypothetical protein
LGLTQSPYTILQILSVALFEKTPFLEAFSPHDDGFCTGDRCNQLNLFD